MRLPTYAVITAARDEEANLPRLARALAAQAAPPTRWLIVENGSSDGTLGLARDLASRHAWIRVVSVAGTRSPVRGAPIVRALHAGFAALDVDPDVIVNVDADVSFAPDYFSTLLARFGEDPALGIAGGACHELQDGEWRMRHVTGSTVWGATRAWRREALRSVLPLEERLGWDGIDEIKANARGWSTRTFLDLPFRHHRGEGERDTGRFGARLAQGRSAWYMGYRPWYLALRALHNARTDPAAVAMLAGFGASALRREPRCADLEARAYLRRQQGLRELRARAREARGGRPSQVSDSPVA